MVNIDLIKPLPYKEIQFTNWYVEIHPNKIPISKRVLFFDPTPLYNKVQHKLHPNKRHQSIQMEDIFPKQTEPICACGCGGVPKHGSNKMKDGTQKFWHLKWASDACQSFANDVLSIMNNYFGKPAQYIDLYHGHVCCECPETNMLELDHVVGVKHGGGACWLSNYVWRCKGCHNKKTNKDFDRGKHKTKLKKCNQK